MNKYRCGFLMIILSFTYHIHAFTQQKEKNTLFPMVEIPDSVRLIVGEFLKEQEHLDTNFTAFYIYNFSNPKDYKFKEGIYTFRLMGPHFLSRLMIYTKGKIYLFKSVHIDGLLEEYLSFIKREKVNTEEKLNYLKLISKFLQEEYQTEREIDN